MGLLDLSSYKVTNNVSPIDATTQDSAYDAIQAVVNALVDANIAAGAAIAIAKLADPMTGKVIGSSGGAAAAVFPPGYRFDYAQIVADVTVSGTSGAQTTVITGNPVTYDGATSIKIEVFLASVLNGAADNVFVELWEGATSIGVTPAINTAGSGVQIEWPVKIERIITPSVGAHTYTVKAYRTSVNGTIKAGSGAAGVVLPSFMRITKDV